MQAVAEMAILVDGDAHAPVSRVDHIRVADDYFVGRYTSREQRLVTVVERIHS